MISSWVTLLLIMLRVEVSLRAKRSKPIFRVRNTTT